MATELTPQHLITQSTKATANAIASTLTVQTASISLPIYDWDSKNDYHSFSIFDALRRTGSTVLELTVRINSDMSLQPWEPNPWRCMHS